MDKTVCFREFEERDIDFIYKCKNNEKLNSMIVGQFKPFSHEDAIKWVHGCMGEHETYKFWAIATNDEEKRIVGWVSISNINVQNKSAFYHGIVIADSNYNDGFAWIETYLFIYDYVFNVLKLHRLYGEHIAEHPMSEPMSTAMYLLHEGVKRDAVYKNGRFYDTIIDAILSDEYFAHLENGDFEVLKIIKRIIKAKKTIS